MGSGVLDHDVTTLLDDFWGRLIIDDQIAIDDEGTGMTLGAQLGKSVVADQACFGADAGSTAYRNPAASVATTVEAEQVGIKDVVMCVDSVESKSLDHQVADLDMAGLVERNADRQGRSGQDVGSRYIVCLDAEVDMTAKQAPL